MKDKIKSFFKGKNNIATVGIIALVVLLVILVAIFSRREHKDKFALNSIYDVYPEEVRNLYTNMVSVSCSGDLHVDVKLDEKATNVSDMNKKTLLAYMFSYLDKNEKLVDDMDVSVIEDATKELFDGDIDLKSEISNYQYGNYTYTLKDKVISRKKSECKSEVFYVSKLYGYSNSVTLLSVDVNMGYSKDGKLYNFADKSLGNYSGNVEDIGERLDGGSFYRYNFVKDGKIYKLASVEWLNRS